ncbi:MAG TPA: DUF2225 domain-containing protein [Pyrinomonadaceae bacterium]|nr:DUF2225 domain-containing protein [Pyrinomonadaceae bacterium]
MKRPLANPLLTKRRLLGALAAAACALSLAYAAAATPAAGASAITWSPAEFECPVCKTKNTFLVWNSYGSYIYSWPSKFELIFWPYTDDPTVYSCKQCRLSAFMGDFEKTPKEKHDAIRKALEGVTLKPRAPSADDALYGEAVYLRVPVTERLLAAQKVYEVLGRDDDFWGHFQRVLGYHFEQEKKPKEADEARRRALAIAERMLADPARSGKRKELLYVTGAMRHFLKDDARALKDFQEALRLRYEDKALKAEQNDNYNKYLDGLLGEYVKKLQTNAAPPKSTG